MEKQPMTKQDILRALESCINALRDVDIPARLSDTSGRTLKNVCGALVECAQGVAGRKPAPEPEKTEE